MDKQENALSYTQLKREKIRKWEIKILTRTLEENDWNHTAAAKALGLDRRNLYRLIIKLGIERKGENHHSWNHQ